MDENGEPTHEHQPPVEPVAEAHEPTREVAVAPQHEVVTDPPAERITRDVPLAFGPHQHMLDAGWIIDKIENDRVIYSHAGLHPATEGAIHENRMLFGDSHPAMVEAHAPV